MKYLGMVHIGKLACVAIHNLEAILQQFLHYKATSQKGDNLQCKKMEPPPLATLPTAPTNQRSS